MARSCAVSLCVCLYLANLSSGATIVSHWTFDNTPNDSNGGRHLTLQGTTSYSTNVPTSISAFSNRSIDLTAAANGATYDVTSGSLTAPYSVAMWVNSTTGTGASGTFFGTRGPTDTSFDAKFQGGNQIHGDIGNGSGWITTAADATFDYQANTWHHIVYNVSTTGYQVYADGSLVGSGPYVGTPLLFDANHDIAIGAVSTGLGENFSGLIDEVFIFSGLLTQTEINNLIQFNSPLAIPEPSSVAIWSLLGIAGIAFTWHRRRGIRR